MDGQRRYRFEEIAEEIRASVRSGAISPGSLLSSERELQQIYDVSRTTIRRALAELVASGWAENTPNRGVITRLGPSRPRSMRVAFVDHRDHVHKTLFFKLHLALAANQFELVHVDSQEVGTMGALQRVAKEDFAAALVWPKVASVDAVDLAAVQARLPVIAVDHSIGGEPSDVVMSDHRMGARMAVAHLVSLGRRRIAISGNFTNLEDAQHRFSGYLTGLYEHDIPAAACDFVFSSPQPNPYEDPRLLRYRLADEDRPDAVFVLHDMSVPPIVDAVMDAGLSVPQDVAVVGFGNDLPLTIDNVGLTTIAMNWDLVAEALVQRVKARLTNPAAPFSRTLIPVRLIIRGSCGAPADRWSAEGYEISSVTTTRRMPPGGAPFTRREQSSDFVAGQKEGV